MKLSTKAQVGSRLFVSSGRTVGGNLFGCLWSAVLFNWFLVAFGLRCVMDWWSLKTGIFTDVIIGLTQIISVTVTQMVPWLYYINGDKYAYEYN